MKYFIIVLLTCSFYVAMAQEKPYAEFNKWSVELNVGQNKPEKPYADGYYSSDPTKYFNFNGVEHYDLGVRYMFNPYFGAKLDFAYDIMNNDKSTSSLPFETNQYRLGLQGVANVSRLLKFESFTKSFGLLLHTGLQVSQLTPKMGPNKNVTEDNGGFMIGLTPQFKISKRIVLTGDFTYLANVRQHFNWDGSYSADANNLTGTLLNTSLGLTFYLGKNKEHVDWAFADEIAANQNIENPYDDKEVKDRLDNLEQKFLDSDGDGVPDYRDEEKGTISGLAVDAKGRALDVNKNGIPDQKEGNLYTNENGAYFSNDPEFQAIVEFEYNVMYYDLDRVDPNKESRKKLFFIIEYLKNHPNLNVRLDGYTDSLGSVESNNKLSQRRVLNLKNILQSYNIDESRIKVEGKGIDTTFSNKKTGEPLARRVNIIFLDKQ